MPVHRHIGLCLVIVLNPAELPFAAAGSPNASPGSTARTRTFKPAAVFLGHPEYPDRGGLPG